MRDFREIQRSTHRASIALGSRFAVVQAPACLVRLRVFSCEIGDASLCELADLAPLVWGTVTLQHDGQWSKSPSTSDTATITHDTAISSTAFSPAAAALVTALATSSEPTALTAALTAAATTDTAGVLAF